MKQNDSFNRLKERRQGLAAAEAEIALSEAIADLVVDARVRAGLTQAQLAKLAGTSQARISELERGEANPTVDTLARIAGALGGFIDLGAFLSLMGSTNVTNSGSFIAVPAQMSFFTTEVTEGAVTTASSGITHEGVVLSNTEGLVESAEPVNSELALAA